MNTVSVPDEQGIDSHGFRNDLEPVPSVRPDWRDLLIRAERGAPRGILANAIAALRFAPEWSGVLAYNEFSLHVVTKASPPWQDAPCMGKNWSDYDDLRACEWLQRECIVVSSKVAAEAVQAVAMQSRNRFHPVRQYLSTLKWDGNSRINGWLTRYLGATDTPFVQAVAMRWLISGVARVFQPGCQADHTLVLEGRQGIRKSSALRILSDPWFTDHVSELGTKDSRLDLLGVWIVEMSELDNARRSDIDRVKAFLTARTDHFRPPYGRRTEDVPRSCIFAATVNDQTPFIDATGNRRFWPVRCGDIAIDDLARDRDHLWAEAYWHYADGKPWWLDSTELNEAAAYEQEERYESGVWDETILDWLNDPTQRYEWDGSVNIPITPFVSSRERVTVTDVLMHGVGKSLDRCTQSDKNQVARCLVHAGWKRKQERSGELRDKWFYIRPSGTGT